MFHIKYENPSSLHSFSEWNLFCSRSHSHSHSHFEQKVNINFILAVDITPNFSKVNNFQNSFAFNFHNNIAC